MYARWIARGDPFDFEWLEFHVATRLHERPRELAIWAELARLHLDRAMRDEDPSALRRVTLILADADRIAADSAELELARGLHAQLEGRHPDAVAAWQRALDLDPTLDEARLRLGLACLEHRDFARASTLLERHVERQPDDPDGWLALGVAYAHTHEPAKARVAYEHAAELAPADPRPHWNLAWITPDWSKMSCDREVAREYERRREHLADLIALVDRHPIACEGAPLPDPQCLAELEQREWLANEAIGLDAIAAEMIDTIWFIHDFYRSPPPSRMPTKVDEQAEAERRRKLLELERAAMEAEQVSEQ
ncbi:tetratricopeptide repeat protein [Nannocystaceae bacterium ST9]